MYNISLFCVLKSYIALLQNMQCKCEYSFFSTELTEKVVRRHRMRAYLLHNLGVA